MPNGLPTCACTVMRQEERCASVHRSRLLTVSRFDCRMQVPESFARMAPPGSHANPVNVHEIGGGERLDVVQTTRMRPRALGGPNGTVPVRMNVEVMVPLGEQPTRPGSQ